MKKFIRYHDKRLASDKWILAATLISHGVPRAEIAEKMGMSIRTVESYVAQAMLAYDCKSQAHLVAFMIRHKIIE